VDFQARPEVRIDVTKHKNLLQNVRLWDWRAFHDTITQIQALRPYYTFFDSDIDRYTIDGQYRQVLLSPRELDIRQLPDARKSWINPHFIYTHGYGLVLAPVSQITPDGLPVLLIDNAPPEVKTSSLKITRPEIYYGEVTHEPIFVHTAEKEFNYPSGADNVQNTYDGKGGFPISSLPMRLAAAVHEADANILLTGYLTPNSRMMIRRKIRPRLERAHMLLCLAWLVRIEDTPEHRQWLDKISADLLAFQQSCGAIREDLAVAFGGHYRVPERNEDYGTSETPLLQSNGDPVSDQLYTTGFALLGLHEAVGATGDLIAIAATDTAGTVLRPVKVMPP
jgi:hypothetical protein